MAKNVTILNFTTVIQIFVISVVSYGLLFSSTAANAQFWRRNQPNERERILPPENTYTNGRAVSANVEPTPEISGSNQDVLFTQFASFDVGKTPEDARTPNAGNGASAQIVNQSLHDIVQGLEKRGVTGTYTQWLGYVSRYLANSAGINSSEVNGLGRLSWYKKIMHDPIKGAEEADEFTRLLHVNLCTGRIGFCKGLKRIADRMDVDSAKIKIPDYFPTKSTAAKALKELEDVLTEAKLCQGRGIAGMSQSDLSRVANYADRVLTVGASYGHIVSSGGNAKLQILAMQKIDYGEMYQGLAELSLLMDPNFITALDGMEEPVIPETPKNTEENENGEESGESESGVLTYEGVTGPIAKIIETQAGIIIVGGREANVYTIEKMTDVCAIVDLGGNDTYIDGVVNLKRPVLAILDLHGNDTYKGTLSGIQGSCILGISMLVDVEGNDQYVARHHAQGSAIGGASALVDLDGNDRYDGIRRIQGTALCGVGLLIDRRGDDSYHAALWSQGLGQTLGCGVLEDCTGDDRYYTGGMYFDSYPETPGYEGWGQGLGTGIRGTAAGGIGVLLEGEGDDHYEFDYIAHGGGYWMGLGFFRDFGGNDEHMGSTAVMWDGSPRRESKFQRFSSGFGCHYAAGFFFEDSGNDKYWASIMSQGFAWDCGISFFFDFLGDDVIDGHGSGNQGQGAQAGFGVLVNYAGNDTYIGSQQGYASGNITYHDLPYCGGNFSFLFDYGGTDAYGCRARNNTNLRRGTNTGFLVDRPTKAELKQAEEEKLKQANEKVEKTLAQQKPAQQ